MTLQTLTDTAYKQYLTAAGDWDSDDDDDDDEDDVVVSSCDVLWQWQSTVKTFSRDDCLPSVTSLTCEQPDNIIQMTHDGECDMLIYMFVSWNVNTRVQPECRHFNFRTYTFACHTSPSCLICFVASITKNRLNSIKTLHFTGTEPYDNYVTRSAHSKNGKIGECEVTPTTASQPISMCNLESQICLYWHNPMSHSNIGLCQCKQSRPVEYLIIANGMWLNLDQ